MIAIALVPGQIQAKGKLSGQEILQLTNAGNARPPEPTRMQATADSAMTLVEGTKASRMPPIALHI